MKLESLTLHITGNILITCYVAPNPLWHRTDWFLQLELLTALLRLSGELILFHNAGMKLVMLGLFPSLLAKLGVFQAWQLKVALASAFARIHANSTRKGS